MSTDLAIPAALILERMGLNLQKDRWSDLARGLERAAAAVGFKDTQAFIAHLQKGHFGRREVEALASELTVCETHFFRSPETFAMLESWLLPEIIAAKQDSTRTLRIWSAGCATGQEAFSLAILVSRLLPNKQTWNVDIMATDINTAAFKTAKAGEYTEWSFRGTPSWVINGYFTSARAGHYRLDPAIRDMVKFEYLNLAEDVYPSEQTGTRDCDLILCRNVLMYFSREVASQVAERLRSAIMEGGYLLVSPSEASREIQGSFTQIVSDGEIIYKKVPDQPAVEQAQSAATAERRSGTALARSQSRPDPATRSRMRRAARPARSPQPAAAHSRSRQASSPRPQAGGLALERRAYARKENTAGEQTEPQAGPVVDPREAARDARLLADKGELGKALDRCEAALVGDKLNPSLYYLKASILQELGRTEEAERALESTLFLDGDFALARVMLGAIARGQARAGEAAKHFRAALAQLAQMPADAVLPETDGLTAGEMAETVASLMGSEGA